MFYTQNYTGLSASKYLQSQRHFSGTAALFACLLTACLCLPLYSCSPSPSKQLPEAHKGRMELWNWNFEKDGTVELDGEWEFYWKQLLTPEDFAHRKLLPRPAYLVPSDTWDGHLEGGMAIGNAGYATYRLVILARSDASLALHLPVIYSAHKVWVDGRLLASSGRVGESQDDFSPSWKTQVVPIDRMRGKTEIIIQASNFFFRRGGLRDRVLLGANAELSGRKYLNVAFMALVFGSLFIMGIYHLSLYVFRKKDRASLYFGLFCLLVAVYTVTGPDEHLIADALPELNGEFVYRLMLLIYIASMPAFFFFQKALYPEDVSRKPGAALVAAAAAYAAAVLLLPGDKVPYLDLLYHPVTIATSIYLVAMLVRSVARKREGALLALGGVLLLFITVINDILYDFGLSRYNAAVPFGVFTFILFYSFILSRRFSTAFTVIERQEAALQQANLGLEARVRERTTSLEQSIHEKEVLLREIHHRVKNNLQVIVSLLNLQSDEVADEATLNALMKSKGRIKSMMLIHEKLYNSGDLAELDFEEYLEDLVADIFTTFGVDRRRIGFEIRVPVRKLDLDAAVPCGLIINELVTNSLKHAFPAGRNGCMVSVRLAESGEGRYELVVADDGVGLPGHIDMTAASTLGLRLVYGLATRQLKGELAITREQGTTVTVRFGKDKARKP